jgi:hypothetical protein
LEDGDEIFLNDWNSGIVSLLRIRLTCNLPNAGQTEYKKDEECLVRLHGSMVPQLAMFSVE